jgi:hypothetical protein
MIFQCTPVSFFWNGWTGEFAGKCININLFSWIRAGVEICIDLAIISLPIPMLVKLQMSWKKKVQILAMFGIGFLYVAPHSSPSRCIAADTNGLLRITLVSILRLKSLIQFAASTNVTRESNLGC